MRRQIGAWAAPIASSSAGLRFQVAIVEGRCIACSRFREQLNTPRPPGAEDKWAGDQAPEADHADGDRREDARQAPAEDLYGEPAADRGDDEAGGGRDERPRPAARPPAREGHAPGRGRPGTTRTG